MSDTDHNRRKDTELRAAVNRIHQSLRGMDNAQKVYEHTLFELCQLSQSEFAFVLLKGVTIAGHGDLRCIATFSANESVCCPQGWTTKITEGLQPLFNAIALNRGTVIDHHCLKQLQEQVSELPKLEQLLCIPVAEGSQAMQLICLANSSIPYHTDFARRVWPLITICASLLRVVDNRNLESLEQKRLLLSQDTWRENFNRLELLLPLGIITLNRDLRIIRVNPAAENLFDSSAEELHLRPVSQLIQLPSSVLAPGSRPQRELDGEPIAMLEVDGRNAQGNTIRLQAFTFQYEEYGQPRISLMVRDNSEITVAKREHNKELLRFRTLSDLAPMGILQTTGDWSTEYVNSRWLDMTGITAQQAAGMGWLKMIYHEDAETTLKSMHSALSNGKEYKGDLRIQNHSGDLLWVALTARPLFTPEGANNGFIATLVDNSYHHESKEKLRQLAEKDPLTGLANRMLFLSRLEHALERVNRHGSVGLLALDLDGFKNTNDTLGHEAGDKMLEEVAQRLKKCVRQEDTVARVGGDEFFILLEGLAEASFASTICEKILKAMQEPFEIQHQEVFISTSIGIAFGVKGTKTSSKAILKQADLALYRAKDAGRNNYQYYSPELERASRRKLELGNSLHRAMGRGEFEVYYQAQARVSDNTITGFEALLRWQHPSDGLLPPDEFIPLLEETGLIAPVSRWIFHVAFHQLREWFDNALVANDCVMSVNVSPRQFRDPGLVSAISSALHDAKLEGQNIAIELTESALITENLRTADILNELKALGIRIALDDFGTGFSSLSYLKKFPIDIIKIDRSFIRELITDREDRAITEAVLVLGRTLGLEVVAEGVETQDILQCLRELHCDMYQGYLLNVPTTAAQLMALLSLPGSQDSTACVDR
ncbi:PAS domain S-box-containing protein/diguanylate cyclase (GGDEF)-like protein [Alteromonadaceae bacterium 2753L.S.0a.02]|nr:PAS domain S-box-containing protein/diguanylate cyclase (GGDEF)-like protein [Alteromonadaceae bacterium 2753L.S.0a.02]